MIAKSLDVVVLLKLLLERRLRPYAEIARELRISTSEVHAAVRRGVRAGLIDPQTRKPLRRPLQDYLLHGVRYAFPAWPGPVARGLPTAYAAAPLADKLASTDLPPVWPDPEGTVRGVAIEPLYKSVPAAARADSGLYQLLVLVDALRIGRARDRQLAEDELKSRLKHAYAA